MFVQRHICISCLRDWHYLQSQYSARYFHIASAGDIAERKVSYITPFKKQIVGPKEAKAIEVYESRVDPHQGFAVDVKVHTPEVGPLPHLAMQSVKGAVLYLACKSVPRPWSYDPVTLQHKESKQERIRMLLRLAGARKPCFNLSLGSDAQASEELPEMSMTSLRSSWLLVHLSHRTAISNSPKETELPASADVRVAISAATHS